jgi:6-phosphofructokinase
MSEAERDAASTELLIQAKLELSDVDFEDIQRHLLVMHHAGVNAIVTAGGDGSWK